MKTLDDLLAEGVAGRRVLVRSDLNVPLDGETITDDRRIVASAPVHDALAKAGARVVVCAHLGRPKGVRDPRYSLRPVAVRLSEVLGREVRFAQDVVGESAQITTSSAAITVSARERSNVWNGYRRPKRFGSSEFRLLTACVIADEMRAPSSE